MANSEKKHIDLIQTAEAIVDAMFPAGVAGRGPGAGSDPRVAAQEKGLKKSKRGKLGTKSVKFGGTKARRKQGGGGTKAGRGTSRATR